jgi:hypothetical protein
MNWNFFEEPCPSPHSLLCAEGEKENSSLFFRTGTEVSS